MKISRPAIVLTLSVLAGVMATALLARWMQTRGASAVPVVVASDDIPLGTPLEAGMLTTLNWPGGRLPEGAVQDPGALVGRVTRSAMSRHEPVLPTKLAPLGARAGLSAAIAPGKRALTVKVNEVMGVAGFALPGSLVDVMVHTRTDDARQGTSSSISRIVLERILVLAVAQDASRDGTSPKVTQAVTLELTPEQAERLDLARGVGSLSLVLRNPADTGDAQTLGARKQDLLGQERVAAQDPPRPPPPAPRVEAAPPSEQTEVIRGLWRTSARW